jgi:GT2 family glycosyltransferase
MTSEAVVPLVSIVIVSWNVREYVKGCLASIRDSFVSGPIEIWVVDNASTDGSVEWLRVHAPDVRVIANDENVGFARANNQAIRQCTGRYTLILNPDTEVADDAIGRLIDVLELRGDIGVVGPLLLSQTEEPDAPCARRSIGPLSAIMTDALSLHRLPLLGAWIGRKLLWPYDYRKSRAVEAISGAAMMFRTESLQKLGGFDERYLHCGEDLDLCKRVSLEGSQVFYEPSARIVHFGGRSSVQESARARTTLASARSIAQYMKTHHGFVASALYAGAMRSVAGPRVALSSICRWMTGGLARREALLRIRSAIALMRWGCAEV